MNLSVERANKLRDDILGAYEDWCSNFDAICLNLILAYADEIRHEKSQALTEDEYLTECDAFGHVPTKKE